MGSAAFILMIITILSKVSGLLREQFTAYYLGTGLLTDVYTTATNIPYTIFGFVVAGVGTSFIPIYNKIKKEQGEEKADLYTANLANILTVVSIAVIAFMVLFMPIMVKIIVPGYSAEKAHITIQFTRIISIATLTSIVSSVYIAYLNLKGSFTIPALTGMIMNLLHILTFYIAYKMNNFFIIAIGYVLADFLKYIMFPHALRKQKYKHILSLDFSDPNIKLMIKMSIPIILSIAAVDISTIVDQSLASVVTKSHGAVSALRFAILILQLVSGVIVVSIGTAMYPRLSAYSVDNKKAMLKKTLMSSITYAQILVYPATIGLMVLATPTFKLLFERGNFNAESTEITSRLLFFYLPSLFGLTIRDLMVRGFYAQRDIKTPVKITVVQEIFHVVLSLILSQFMGVPGLALATSISSILGGFLILLVFRKKYGKINLRSFSIKTIKILIASLLMGLVTQLVYNKFINHGVLISFMVAVAVSIVVYGIIILIMQLPEVKSAINMLYKKIKRK